MRIGKTARKAQLLRLPVGILAAVALLALSGCQGLSLFGLFESENPGLFSVSPSAAVLQTDQTITLHALGGFGTYSFDYPGLEGSFDPATGVYTPPAPPVAEPLTEIISVSDEVGNQRTATLTVYNEVAVPLVVTPSSWTGTVGDTKIFAIGGGFAPYAAALDAVSLPVAVDQVTVNTAGLAAGEHRLEITDAMQSLAVAQISLIPAEALGIDPPSARVVSGGSVVFTALNALGALEFSVEAPGTGFFAVPTASPATYQAPIIPPETGTMETVLLTNGARWVKATVQVYNASSPLDISPSYSELLPGETLELKASGGVPPYTFALSAGRGTVEQTGAAAAVYTAPVDLPTRAQVTLLDSVGSLPVYAVIKVNKPR